MRSAAENKTIPSRWSRVVSKAGSLKKHDQAVTILALRSELVSLREENARLRMANHGQPGIHQTIDRLRCATKDHLVTGQEADLAEEADHLWHVLAEAVVIREGLLSACRDLSNAATSLEGRLQNLIPQLTSTEKLSVELEELVELTNSSEPVESDASDTTVIQMPSKRSLRPTASYS